MDWIAAAAFKASLVGLGWGILIGLYKITFGRTKNQTNKTTAAPTAQNDEHLYELAHAEFHSSNRKKGLHIKLLTINNGDEKKTEFEYIKARVFELGKQPNSPIIKSEPAVNNINFKVKKINNDTVFQQLIRELGLPSWFEDLLIVIFFVFSIYLLFNFVGFFR